MSKELKQIARQLKNEDSSSRIDAIRRLCEIADSAAVGAMDVLLDDQTTDVRKLVISSFEKIGGERVLDLLAGMLKDPDEKIRREAAKALGIFKAEKSVEPLISLLADGSETMFVKAEVQKALCTIDEPAFGPLLQSLASESAELRKRAAETLAMMGDNRALPHVLKLAEDADERVRAIAVETLGFMGTDSVEPLLALLSDTNVTIRRRAVIALGQIGDKRATKPLVAMLKDKDVYTKGYAARALGILGDVSAIEPLIDSLYECNWDAAKALEQIGKDAFQPLTRALYFDKLSARTRAADVLLNVGGKDVIEPMIEALNSESWGIRITAIDILSRVDDERVFSILLDALKDDYWNVRKVAVEALGRLGNKRAIEPMKEMLNDEDEIVRRCAKDELARLNKL